MKQNRGDWMDAVRRSLSEANPLLPEGGWERLERELRSIPETSAAPSGRKIWLKFAAAAAAVLVCVSIGFRVVRMDSNVLKRVVMVPEAAVSGQNTGVGESSSAPVDLILLQKTTTHVRPRVTREVEGVQRDIAVAVLDSQTPLEATSYDMDTTAFDGMEASPADTLDLRSQEGKQRIIPKDDTYYQTVDYDGLFASAQPQRHGGASVSFAAGGVVTSAGGGRAGESASYLMISEGAASLRNAYEEFSYDHKQPLSFGVTFRKQLGYGLSAESGLIYTLLRSDVAVPGGVRDVRQRLHMLGIPLRVNWEFLQRGRFSLYAGAGGMVEKCVDASFGGESVRERGVQWSIFGVVGAQYRLGKVVGIYFEPEVSHYLTRTTLHTSYTDSSVGLNLQLGVRFSY